MTFFESVRVALDMLRLHKLRAFLTMLGVIIGVMAVSLIFLISAAMNEYITNQFSKIGSDTIYVSFAPNRLERGTGTGDIDRLTTEDITYLMERVPEIEIASGFRSPGNIKLNYADREVKEVDANAIDGNFIELNRVELLRGRNLSRQDDEQHASVCTISEDVEKELFGTTSGLGKLVQSQGISLEVVGITKPLELMGSRDTKAIFMPLSTANSKLLGGDRVDLILMRAKKGEDPNKVMDQIWEALMLKSNNRVLYAVESSQNVLKIFSAIIGTIGTVLVGIAAFSLLVAGIGIMNIMLVSVTERTKEIGLRKAVGAQRGSILMQFLVEAAVLSLVGGLIGLGLAYMCGLGVSAITKVAKWPQEGGLGAPFPIEAGLVTMAISAAIGCVFGLYPAVRASALSPIEALRTE